MRMKKNVRLAVVGVAALVAVYVAMSIVQNIRSRDRAPLAPFNSEVGRFTVLLPQGVRTEVDLLETKIGQLEFHTYEAQSKSVKFVIAYVDYPPDYVEQTGSGQLLKNAAQSSADNFNGRTIDEKAFMLGEQAVREVLIKAPKGVYVRSRIIIIGNRLYQTMAISTRRHIRDRKVEDVFGSLSISVPPPPASADSLASDAAE